MTIGSASEVVVGRGAEQVAREAGGHLPERDPLDLLAHLAHPMREASEHFPGDLGVLLQEGSEFLPRKEQHFAVASDSGMGIFHEFVPSPAITCAHTGSAPAEPVNPVGALSS